MSYNDLYAMTQYTAAICLMMVGFLQLRRWSSATAQTQINRAMIAAVAILMLILGVKQLFMSIYGTAIAANVRTTFPESPLPVLLFNVAITVACVAIFVTASKADRTSYQLIATAVSVMTLTAFYLVGGM